MKVTQEKLPDSQIRLEIEIPAQTSQATYEKVVQNLARSTQIPGFRKGKVPRQVLVQRLGSKKIKEAVVQEMIQKSLEEAIEQESIKSLGNYRLRSNFEELVQHYQPGEPLTFSASIDIPPNVILEDYQNLEVTAEETAYNPQDIEEWLSKQQDQHATLVPVEDRSAQMGDVAIVDYIAKELTETGEAGEDIASVQGKDFRVDMDAGRFLEGMVESMVGMKPEETKDISLKFPDDYPNEELAGKPAIFSIILKELKEKELPEFDDDFAQEVSEYETIAELRETLEKRFREQAETETKNQINEAIVKELRKIGSVELPETLIEPEITQVLTQTFMQMQQMGIDVKQLFSSENLPVLRNNAKPEAIERLTKSLIIQKIAEMEGIEVSETEIKEKIQKVTEQYSQRDLDMERLHKLIEEEILTEKTLNLLQEKVKVNLVPKGSLEPPSEEGIDEEIIELEASDLSEDEGIIDVEASESSEEE